MCSSIAGPYGFQLDGFLNFEELKRGLKVPAAVSEASGMELLPRASFLRILKWNFDRSSAKIPGSGGGGVSTKVKPLDRRHNSSSLS